MKRILPFMLSMAILFSTIFLHVFAADVLSAKETAEIAEIAETDHQHDYETVITEPTCTEPGYTSQVCVDCGDTKLETRRTDISNLFTWTAGKMIIATNGACNSYDYWKASDYVDVSSYDSIQIVTANTIHIDTTAGLAFYDANKKYISGVKHTDGVGKAYGTLLHTLEIPEDAVYVRSTWYLPSHPNYDSSFGEFSCTATGQYVPATGHSYTLTSVTSSTCTAQGSSVYTCSTCGDSYAEYVNRAEHIYNDGVCTVCGVKILGSDWIAPDFADGEYTMVVLPDTQNLVQYWPQIYYNQMQWIADNKDTLNIQAVLHMGDMVNTNNDTQWTVCEAGTDILNAAGIPWMPMRGNHDDSAWFNKYYDYTTYGTKRNWFGGAYDESKLDYTYWFVTVGEQEYMILSLGWAPNWDVLTWAQGIVEDNLDKHVILACHAYMNKDGTLLGKGDAHCVSSYYAGYPDGDDVWAAFKDYGNVVLAMGGHIHSADLVTYTDKNGAGRNVTSLLVDRQDDDTKNRYAMIALLTFHTDSETVDVNWYSTRYDALFRAKNQFSITLPDVCVHSYQTVAVGPTCTEGGGMKYTCAICGYSYLEENTEPLGHNNKAVSIAPTCTAPGYVTNVCSVCGHEERETFANDITGRFQWKEGYVISAINGNMTVDKNWVASDYVDISEYSAIEIVTGDTVNASTTLGIAFYDANKAYISGVKHTDQVGNTYGILVHELKVPENAVYVRTTWYSVNHGSYDGATRHTFYCKGYSTEIPPVGHSFINESCETCGTVRMEITERFSDWTAGGPVLFADGWGYGESGYTSGRNANLKYSGFVSVEGIDILELTVCARKGNTATGGYAFYTDKGAQYFISEGASTRNGNGASAEGTVLHTVAVPKGAKYIRVSYWVDNTTHYAAVPFRCVGFAEGNGPVIQVQPQGIEAAQGETFSITVEAEGAGLKYQWYYRNAGSDTFRKAFSKGATFEATMNRIRAGREMYCVITDASGNTVTTDTVKLIRIPKAELKITQEPESVTAKLGEEFTITVEAEGEDLTYRWFYRNPGEEAFRSFTTGSNTYTAKMNSARAGRELYCVVTDALGNQVTTGIVDLTLAAGE